MYLTGFADEVGSDLARQIEVCRTLGWTHIDLRSIDSYNIVDLPDATFNELEGLLQANALAVNSFGSPIANWSRRTTDPFSRDLEDLERAIPRMNRLGVRHIRVMSYRPAPELSDLQNERVIVKRLSELARRAEDAGVVLLHENCETWGGQSVEHTERLLNAIDSPAFKLVFDTGNPPATIDRRDHVPAGTYQNGLEFFRRVRRSVASVHIKDARIEAGEVVYTGPGEGDGFVPEILRELRADGYDGAVSIEPHLAVVYHDPTVTADDQERWNVFVEYARQTHELLVSAGFSIALNTAP